MTGGDHRGLSRIGTALATFATIVSFYFGVPTMKSLLTGGVSPDSKSTASLSSCMERIFGLDRQVSTLLQKAYGEIAHETKTWERKQESLKREIEGLQERENDAKRDQMKYAGRALGNAFRSDGRRATRDASRIAEAQQRAELYAQQIADKQQEVADLRRKIETAVQHTREWIEIERLRQERQYYAQRAKALGGSPGPPPTVHAAFY